MRVTQVELALMAAEGYSFMDPAADGSGEVASSANGYGLTGRELMAILGGDYEETPGEMADDYASLPPVEATEETAHPDDCTCDNCTFPW